MLRDSIPVAMYHHVSESDRELNVQPGVFEDQLRGLRRKGWKTLTGDEFLNFMREPKEKPKKCVLLTFDDGFADNYVFAYPLLKKYGMKAMFFIATDFIDDVDVKRDGFVSLTHNDAWELASTGRRSEVMCTWREIEEMHDAGVVDVQSHGMSHGTPDLIMQKKYKALRDDLTSGKAILETRLSKKVLHFAWPRGHYDGEAVRIAEEVGYEALYTTERGANTPMNVRMINRLPVKCKKGSWLSGKLPIYSSTLLSRIYLSVRTGI